MQNAIGAPGMPPQGFRPLWAQVALDTYNGLATTGYACYSVLAATATSIGAVCQVLGDTTCLVLHAVAMAIQKWVALVMIIFCAAALHFGSYRDVGHHDLVKADFHCNDLWVDKHDVSPHCILKPNEFVCRWRRMKERKVMDYIVPLGNLGFDDFLLNNTGSEETKCDIWYRTDERDWLAISPIPYQEQACKCRRVEAPNHFIINAIRYLVGSAYDAGMFLLYIAGVGATMISSIVGAWIYRRYNRGSCIPPQPMHCRWTFNRSKYDAKQGQHGHPFLNTYRSSRRSALLGTLTKLGKVVNLFGCGDDAKGVPNANKILSLQTANSYNLLRTNRAQMYDTYDATIDAAVAADKHKYILCYDSAWYLSPDQIVKLVSGNRVLVFNMKTKGYGNHKIRDPISQQMESTIINDGIHYQEKVSFGDQYSHRACSLPHRDSFCLEHKGDYVFFQKVKMIHDGDEDLTSIDGYECVYSAQSINLRYSDGKLSDHFGETGVKAALLFDHTHRCTGAIIPNLVNGKHTVRKLTDEEFNACLSCLTLPDTARFTVAATNKLRQFGFGLEREHLLEVVHMLRHREAFDVFVPVHEGLIGYMWNVLYLWFAMMLRTLIGRTWFGRGVVHIDSSRWYTEDAMMEEVHGQNSQEAGTQADGPSGGPPSCPADSGGSPRGPDGTGQSKEKATKTKTSKDGPAGKAKKADSGVRPEPKRGASTAADKGDGPGGAKGKASKAATGKSGKAPTGPRKGDGVGASTGGSGVAGETTGRAKTKTGGDNAAGQPRKRERDGQPRAKKPRVPPKTDEEDFSEIRSADYDPYVGSTGGHQTNFNEMD